MRGNLCTASISFHRS